MAEGLEEVDDVVELRHRGALTLEGHPVVAP